MFEGAKVGADHTTHPRVVLKGGADADDIAAEMPADEVLLFDTKLFRGWRVSYRKEQPEQHTTSRFEPILTRNNQIPEGIRHRPWEEQANKQQLSKDRRNKKSRAADLWQKLPE
jgi:hypothetical protein